MLTMATSHRSRGHTLIELIISMVVLGVVGAAIVRLIVVESRLFQAQDASNEARKVARAAVNLLTSELRMVEVSAGVTAASATSITFRVPYAIGIVCASGTISTMPVDSLMYAQATFSGYAWRDTLGAYNYATSGASAGAGSAGDCTSASITTLTGGKVVSLSPALPSGAKVGNPVFLFQTITYSFGASGLLPGRRGLFRQVGGGVGGAAEEIAAPFDSATTRFRFFVLNADAAQDAVPANLADIRGIELALTGASRLTPRGRTTPKTVATTTAVFFQNRLN
jgi:prepilin-type N-terminal cleavage/methylation domain-containing protein